MKIHDYDVKNTIAIPIYSLGQFFYMHTWLLPKLYGCSAPLINPLSPPITPNVVSPFRAKLDKKNQNKMPDDFGITTHKPLPFGLPSNIFKTETNGLLYSNPRQKACYIVVSLN